MATDAACAAACAAADAAAVLLMASSSQRYAESMPAPDGSLTVRNLADRQVNERSLDIRLRLAPCPPKPRVGLPHAQARPAHGCPRLGPLIATAFAQAHHLANRRSHAPYAGPAKLMFTRSWGTCRSAGGKASTTANNRRNRLQLKHRFVSEARELPLLRGHRREMWVAG